MTVRPVVVGVGGQIHPPHPPPPHFSGLGAAIGNESMVRCLLEEGANASAVDARGMTPIAHAAQGGNLLAVRALLKAKTTGGTGRLVDGCLCC